MNITIIGAGINGLMAAFYLKHAGYDVVVYDKGDIPNIHAASYGRHRLIHPYQADFYEAICARNYWLDILKEIKAEDCFITSGVIALPETETKTDIIPQEAVCLDKASAVKLMPLLEGGTLQELILYPHFGILLADKILHHLTRYLIDLGVRFFSHKAAITLDLERNFCSFADGTSIQSDMIIIAAGTGAASLLTTLPALTFQTMRTYVLYGYHPEMIKGKNVPAWASLGSGDLWGMPPVNTIPLKLGCGTLTHELINPHYPIDETLITQKIIKLYAKKFPKFSQFYPQKLSYNHWTKINHNARFYPYGKGIIITSDSGAGFKFAPITAKNVMLKITKSVF